jgi:hypothetical protein
MSEDAPEKIAAKVMAICICYLRLIILKKRMDTCDNSKGGG